MFSSIWGATTPYPSWPGSDGSEGVLPIPSSTWTSPSDGLVSYTGHSLVGYYLSAKMQSVYTLAPADGARIEFSGLDDCQV